MRKKIILNILLLLAVCRRIFLTYVSWRLLPLLVTLLVFHAGIGGEGDQPVLMVNDEIAERYWYDGQGRPREMLRFRFKRFYPVISFSGSRRAVKLLYPLPTWRARWVYGQSDSEDIQQVLLANIKRRTEYEDDGLYVNGILLFAKDKDGYAYEDNGLYENKYEYSSLFPTRENLEYVTASWSKLDEWGRISFYGFDTKERDINKILGDFKYSYNDFFLYEYDDAGRLAAEYSIRAYGSKKGDYILNSYEGSFLTKKSYYKVWVSEEGEDEGELYYYKTYAYEEGLLVQECSYDRPDYTGDVFEQCLEYNYEYENGRLVKVSGRGKGDCYYYY